MCITVTFKMPSRLNGKNRTLVVAVVKANRFAGGGPPTLTTVGMRAI
jgi:hypothetical protein